LDTQGRVLSKGGDDEDQTALSSTQLEMQRSVEEALEHKGQSLLDEILGDGNSIIRVSASLDFSRTISSSEIIDPESATVVSEEKIDEQLSESSTANSSVRNYEMTRTSESHEKGVGTINNITVSVVLNQRPESVTAVSDDAGAPTETTYRSFSDVEVAELTSLIQNAVGLDSERGDRISVVQTRFEVSENPLAEGFGDFEDSERMAMYLRYGLIAIALLMVFLLIRRAGRQVTKVGSLSAASRPAPTFPSLGSGFNQSGASGGREVDYASFSPPAQEDPPEVALLPSPPRLDSYTENFAPDPRANIQPENPLFGQVRDLVSNRPEDAAAVIREWMSNDPLVG
jgi:flagellar M-ring protein FliF